MGLNGQDHSLPSKGSHFMRVKALHFKVLPGAGHQEDENG